MNFEFSWSISTVKLGDKERFDNSTVQIFQNMYCIIQASFN